MFLRKKIGKSTTDCWKEIEKLEKQIQQADAIIIGAGAGLSISDFIMRENVLKSTLEILQIDIIL